MSVCSLLNNFSLCCRTAAQPHRNSGTGCRFERNTQKKPAMDGLNHYQGIRELLMGTKGIGNGWYDDKVWDQIQAEWLAGQLSLSDISRTYGPSRATIRVKAKRYNWPPRGSLLDQVRKEIDSQLLDEGGCSGKCSTPRGRRNY